MFVNALCVSMGVLLIITLKTTMHLKHKRLLPICNNKYQGRVYKEKKAEGQYRGRRYLEIQQKLGGVGRGGERELDL